MGVGWIKVRGVNKMRQAALHRIALSLTAERRVMVDEDVANKDVG